MCRHHLVLPSGDPFAAMHRNPVANPALTAGGAIVVNVRVIRATERRLGYSTGTQRERERPLFHPASSLVSCQRTHLSRKLPLDFAIHRWAARHLGGAGMRDMKRYNDYFITRHLPSGATMNCCPFSAGTAFLVRCPSPGIEDPASAAVRPPRADSHSALLRGRCAPQARPRCSVESVSRRERSNRHTFPRVHRPGPVGLLRREPWSHMLVLIGVPRNTTFVL